MTNVDALKEEYESLIEREVIYDEMNSYLVEIIFNLLTVFLL